MAPLGNVYQAGTLSGNPIAMITGFTLLSELKNNPSFLQELDAKTQYLKEGLEKVLKEWSQPYTINHLGSMISVHFGDKPVTDFASATTCDIERFKNSFMLCYNVACICRHRLMKAGS